MVHAALVGRRARRVGRALLVGEDRDQPPVARVEVEVALRLAVEVRLLEHERHAEHALPEVDRRLPVGSDDRDVVNALALELSHASPSARPVSTCTRCAAGCPTAPAPLGSAPRARCEVSRGSLRRGRHRRSAPRASSTLTGSGGSCLTPGAARPHEDVAADGGRERADDLADRGREDVDAADDQHVVGAADAADARAGAPARARARADLDVVARAEAQQRRGAVAQVGEHELAGRAVLERRARRRSRGRSARGGRSRGRRGACRPGARTRPTARRRCRRSPSPR